MARTALPAVAELVQGVCEPDSESVDAAVRKLIGLGPGLTPSGDYLPAALMVGLRAALDPASTARSGGWGAHERPDGPVMNHLTQSVLKHSVHGTNLISGVLLRYAAPGTGSRNFHRLVNVLLQPWHTSQHLTAALAVASAGHTSGWDYLSGVLLGISLGLRLNRKAVPEEAWSNSFAFESVGPGLRG